MYKYNISRIFIVFFGKELVIEIGFRYGINKLYIFYRMIVKRELL